MGIYNGAVLQTTDDTGAPFRLAPGVWQIRCSVHAGGTWQLEYRRDAADRVGSDGRRGRPFHRHQDA